MCSIRLYIHSWHDLFTLSLFLRKRKAGAPAKDEANRPKKAKGSLRAASMDDYVSELRLELFEEVGAGARAT